MPEGNLPLNLPLASMHERHLGLTPEVSAYYWQAACVCLDRHHTPPVVFALLDGIAESQAEVSWLRTDERVRGAWANEIDTTEAGAYACALAGTELMRGFVAVRRAETGTGADYYVGLPGAGVDDLEDCFRLEVSGVDAGDATALRRRLESKVTQAREGRSNLPALASVVGFKAMQIYLAEVREDS
jgi:hypothetical protein